MTAEAPRFIALGDTGLAIDFGERIARDVSRRVLALQARIAEQGLAGEAGQDLAGIVEMVPTFRSLLLHLDPDVSDLARLEAAISPLLDDLDGGEAPFRRWSIPVCYEGEMAPDLESVADSTGLTPAQVVDVHAGVEYHVYMIGFLPGYPYMGDLPDEIVLPRRDDPRLELPPGSVAIATTLTAIYPVKSPGGWHLIGRTPIALFDAANDPPALLRPGDKVKFKPVTSDEYGEIDAACRDGSYELAPVDQGA